MSRPRIVCVGGGPAGLYFAILMKRAFPAAELRVLERNRPDDTFGWGVVFSDETLINFERADPQSYAAITARFRSWRDIEVHHRGTVTVSTGHGFAALERRELLLVLQRRCRELGVELEFEREVADLGELADADLIVGADGANSLVRRLHAAQLGPRLDRRRCRYSWLGTDLELRAFTFIFEETPFGLFQVHAYPFAPGRSTWIVECRAEVLERTGLKGADEAATVAFCERLFARYLDGHRLLANRSQWRTFETVRCARWRCGKIVLLGDAAHTAHFSIGSGTKLAMEDAIALSAAFRRRGLDDAEAALAEYEAARHLEVLKLQRAAQTSLEWFENSARYLEQPPVQLTFNLMTRSKRITYDNLRQRDPALIERVNEWFATEGERMEPGSARFSPLAATPILGGRAEPGSGVSHPLAERARGRDPLPRPSTRPPAPAPPPMFTPLRLRELELANRIVVSPMCQYSAVEGAPQDWHLVHLGSRAIGGAGLVMTEMTDVSPEGRITHACTGMYTWEHAAAWRRVVDFVHAHSPARIGLQLAHAGRKGSVRHPWEGEDVPLRPEEGGWQTLAPSALPFRPHWPAPRAMSAADMENVRADFVRATRLAEEAGFDLVELHMAHGYLLSSFLSPLANERQDDYGGPLENRMRFPLAVFAAMRAAWPPPKPMAVRISATDWLEEEGRGFTADEAVELARALAAAGCDLVDVSSSGNSPESRPDYGRMYHAPFAERIRHEVGVRVAVVGALLGADHANTVLAAGRADLAVLARPHLRDPYLTLHAAEHYGFDAQLWPGQYLLARPRPKTETR